MQWGDLYLDHAELHDKLGKAAFIQHSPEYASRSADVLQTSERCAR